MDNVKAFIYMSMHIFILMFGILAASYNKLFSLQYNLLQLQMISLLELLNIYDSSKQIVIP